MQQSGSRAEAEREALDDMMDAEAWVVIAVRKGTDGHEFRMHYTHALTAPTLVQYASGVVDAWLGSGHETGGDDNGSL